MDWQKLYLGAADGFRSRLPSSKGVAVVFNTNIDGVINLDGERLERFLVSQRMVSDEAFLRKDSPPGRIDGPVDFVTGLMHFMERGAGGEYMVHDDETYEWIVSNLPIDEYRMGGNAGIMSNALSELGAKFVIPHAVQLPEKQARLFLNRENILLPVTRNGEIVFASPSTASRKDRELVHLILEFKEGTAFSWQGKRISSPRNNRYIVNADDFNGKIIIDPAFVMGVTQKISDIDKFILTGLHMLKRSYPDGATYLDRLKEALGLVARCRELNPALKVHFELADIQDEIIRGDVISMACEVSDSVGMNEDELSTVLGEDDLLSRGPHGMVDGMFKFVSTYGVGKLLLHSKDFAVSLVLEDYCVDPGIVRDSQMLGILASQNRAYSDDFGSVSDLENLIISEVLEPSQEGLRTYRRFGMLGEEVEPCIWLQEREGKKYWVVVTPCLLSRTTLNTVGLGDCLTAGSVLGEIAS